MRRACDLAMQGRVARDPRGVTHDQAGTEGPAVAQAAVGPDGLRGRHRRRLRGRHAGLHRHDRRVVQEPLRAHPAGRRRRDRGRARRSSPTSRSRRRCPPTRCEKVKATPGVEVAEGGVSSDGTLLDKQGKPIVSNGPPTLLLSINTEEVFTSLDYESGGPPKTDDEVALDRGTANKYDFKVGDTVTVSGTAPAKQFKVSGIASLGGQDNLGGARLVVLHAARGAADDRPRRLRLDLGLDRRQRRRRRSRPRCQRELGRDFLVRTGEEAAEQQAQDFSDALGFIRIALLVFAGVALLVGGFLIFNTFTVTVAQRTKEFALLRVLGASRGQILRSVLIETFVVGLVASILGVLVGLAGRAGAGGAAGRGRHRPRDDRAWWSSPRR